MSELGVAYNRLKLMSAFLLRRGAFAASPSVVTVETTNRCNLACPSCFKRVDPLPEQDLPMDLFVRLVEDENGKFDTFNLYGMGEPLLDPLLLDRIELCNRRGIKTILATNATLLDEIKAKELLQSRVSAVVFSMDSLHPEVYQRLRPGASYQATVENIVSFLDRREQSAYRPLVAIQMLKTRLNRKETGAMRRFWIDRGADAVRIMTDQFHTLPDNGNADTAAPGPCVFLWQGPALVRADGGIYPCCDSGLGGRPMADLGDTLLSDFWTGEKMTELRRNHLEGKRYPGVDCYACKSTKPVPFLACLSCLADGMEARRWGMRIERWTDLFQWRLLYREID